MKFCAKHLLTILIIIKHQRRWRLKKLFVVLQKLSVVSRSRASTSGVFGGTEGVGLLLDGQTETLFTFLFFFFCLSFSFCKDSFLRFILSFIFSLSAFGGASELLELELEELELLASLVLELEAFGVAEIGVGT